MVLEGISLGMGVGVWGECKEGVGGVGWKWRAMCGVDAVRVQGLMGTGRGSIRFTVSSNSRRKREADTEETPPNHNLS